MPSALVVGTDHAFQRRQDLSQRNEAVRNKFEKVIQTTIGERKTDGIAEEAGDDREVWEYLQAQDASTPPELRALFGGIEIVDSPQPTIAKSVAETNGLCYADIRAHGAEKMTVAERDEVMALAVHDRFGGAEFVVVIVGEEHRSELARILSEKYGWTTESRCCL